MMEGLWSYEFWKNGQILGQGMILNLISKFQINNLGEIRPKNHEENYNTWIFKDLEQRELLIANLKKGNYTEVE